MGGSSSFMIDDHFFELFCISISMFSLILFLSCSLYTYGNGCYRTFLQPSRATHSLISGMGYVAIGDGEPIPASYYCSSGIGQSGQTILGS